MNGTVEEMDISVLVLTYNHDRFVSEALRSIAIQEFDGGWELVIVDDASTDQTLDMIRKAVMLMPPNLEVRVMPSNRNLGMQMNLRRGIEACRGEFIALLEGDDCWTDPRKLSIQWAALRHNPHLSASAHLTNLLTVDSAGGWMPSETMAAKISSGGLGPNDVVMGRFPHTSSLLIRREMLPSTPRWLDELEIGDWPVCALLAVQGPIDVEPTVMSMYRKGVGIHSTESLVTRWRRTVDCCEAMVLRIRFDAAATQLALARAYGSYALALALARRPVATLKFAVLAAARAAGFCVRRVRRG